MRISLLRCSWCASKLPLSALKRAIRVPYLEQYLFHLSVSNIRTGLIPSCDAFLSQYFRWLCCSVYVECWHDDLQTRA